MNDEHPLDQGTNWAATLGITGTTTVPSLEQFPTLKPTGYITIGDSLQEPVTYTTNNFDTNDTMTWNHGKHTVKVGGSMLRVQYYQPTNSEFSGTATFNGRNTGPVKNSGNAFAEFLLGAPSSAGLRFGTVVNHLFERDFAGFAQDDYKLLDRLTLNIGLRYEYQSLVREENSQLASFDPTVRNSTGTLGALVLGSERTIGGDAGLQNILNTYGATAAYPYITTAAAAGLPENLVNPNHLRFAPRVGWAWRPSINNSTGGPRQLWHLLYRVTAERAPHRIGGQFPVLHCGGPKRNQRAALTKRVHPQPRRPCHQRQRLRPKCAVFLSGELQPHGGARVAQGARGRDCLHRIARTSSGLAGGRQSGPAEHVSDVHAGFGSRVRQQLPKALRLLRFGQSLPVQCVLELQRRDDHS